MSKRKSKEIKAEAPSVIVHRISRLSSRRGLPLEQLPEGLEILRFLCNQTTPLTTTDLSDALGMREGLVVLRMPRLERAKAVVSSDLTVPSLHGSTPITRLAYTASDYGRACATGDIFPPQRVNSVFNLAQFLTSEKGNNEN